MRSEMVLQYHCLRDQAEMELNPDKAQELLTAASVIRQQNHLTADETFRHRFNQATPRIERLEDKARRFRKEEMAQRRSLAEVEGKVLNAREAAQYQQPADPSPDTTSNHPLPATDSIHPNQVASLQSEPVSESQAPQTRHRDPEGFYRRRMESAKYRQSPEYKPLSYLMDMLKEINQQPPETPPPTQPNKS